MSSWRTGIPIGAVLLADHRGGLREHWRFDLNSRMSYNSSKVRVGKSEMKFTKSDTMMVEDHQVKADFSSLGHGDALAFYAACSLQTP